MLTDVVEKVDRYFRFLHSRETSPRKALRNPRTDHENAVTFRSSLFFFFDNGGWSG